MCLTRTSRATLDRVHDKLDRSDKYFAKDGVVFEPAVKDKKVSKSFSTVDLSDETIVKFFPQKEYHSCIGIV